MLCLKDTDPSPTDDDFERYIVVTDSSGKVLRVVYNRIIDCPVKSPVATETSFCESNLQVCSYAYETNALPDAQCDATDTCTCRFGSWDCLSSIACVPLIGDPVSTPPAIITICPELSPLVSTVMSCDTVEECTFIYKSTPPGAVCENTDTCNCSDGQWKCESGIACVPDEAPFIIGCPAESPAVSNVTVCGGANQETPCIFKYGSTIPGGICQNTDNCTCSSDTGLWACVREIGCVSDNPPFIIGCPAESPAVSNVTACDAEHQEQPCIFQYGSTIPGGICQNTDNCTCSSDTGLWACDGEISCVSDNPPFRDETRD